MGAALIGLVAAVSSGFVIYETRQLDARVRTLLSAEERLEMYSALSTQITTLAVASLDQDASPTRRDATILPLDARITRTFEQLKTSIEKDVAAAADLGIDEQSRRATRSIMLVRMEAIYEGIDPLGPRDNLQARLNIFSTTFQPLLGSSINEEQRTRDRAFEQIAQIREGLNFLAFASVAAVIALMVIYVLGFVRPLISRINLMRDATARIGQQDFSISLPDNRRDEIGLLFAELNNSSEQLETRQTAVETESKRLSNVIDERTEALRDANAALAETDENRRRFFAGVSHEMRTPLTVIITEAEIGAAEDPEKAAAFEIIHSRAKSLNRRVDDLLRLARSETGELKVETEPFELNAAARIALDDNARLTSRAGLTVSLKESATVQVIGDRNWTRQVISAAIENVVRHAAVANSLSIEIEVQPQNAVLRIIDNGPGIPKDEQASVFDRFAQGSAKSSSEGFGIGLHFARALMTAQNGDLALASPVPNTHAIDDQSGMMLILELPLANAQ